MTPTQALDAALQIATGLSSPAMASSIERGLHARGFAILPISDTIEIGESVVCDGRWIIILDDLSREAAAAALDTVLQAGFAAPARETAP